jgi:hypothetical protein
MSLRSAAFNLTQHGLIHARHRLAPCTNWVAHRYFDLTGRQAHRRYHHPQRPADAALKVILPVSGVQAFVRDYALLNHVPLGHRPIFPAAPGWEPRYDGTLEDRLPHPWDPLYQTHYIQDFQPVKLWRNTLTLCEMIETDSDPNKRKMALNTLRALVERMQEFTREAEGAAWLENRFAYINKEVRLPKPWVSGIGNAFAILACLRMRKHLPTTALAHAYARAFQQVYVVGQSKPERWISACDADGYLWFEEYPRPKGRLLHVKNGHIFALLALHEISLLEPNSPYQTLVQAGACTIEAYTPCLRRPGMVSLYAVNWWRKPDYLPARAVRQLYQLYHLTGAQSFLSEGDLFLQDMATAIDPDSKQTLRQIRADILRQRPLAD